MHIMYDRPFSMLYILLWKCVVLVKININHNILFCFVDMLPDIDKKPDKQVIIKMAGYLEKKGRMVSNNR